MVRVSAVLSRWFHQMMCLAFVLVFLVCLALSVKRPVLALENVEFKGPVKSSSSGGECVEDYYGDFERGTDDREPTSGFVLPWSATATPDFVSGDVKWADTFEIYLVDGTNTVLYAEKKSISINQDSWKNAIEEPIFVRTSARPRTGPFAIHVVEATDPKMLLKYAMDQVDSPLFDESKRPRLEVGEKFAVRALKSVTFDASAIDPACPGPGVKLDFSPVAISYCMDGGHVGIGTGGNVTDAVTRANSKCHEAVNSGAALGCCKLVGRNYTERCVALVVGGSKDLHVGVGRTKRVAEKKAKRVCGTGCRVLAGVCGK